MMAGLKFSFIFYLFLSYSTIERLEFYMYLPLLYTDLLQRLEENLVGTMEALVNKGSVYSITDA